MARLKREVSGRGSSRAIDEAKYSVQNKAHREIAINNREGQDAVAGGGIEMYGGRDENSFINKESRNNDMNEWHPKGDGLRLSTRDRGRCCLCTRLKSVVWEINKGLDEVVTES